MKKTIKVVIGFILFVGGVGVGVYTHDYFRPKEPVVITSDDIDKVLHGILSGDDSPPELKGVDFKNYWLAWNLIRERFAKGQVSDAAMFYGSMSGLVSSLKDPHSAFFDPETAAMMRSDMAGTFYGIGAEVGLKDERLTIIAPIPDTPAAKAGLLAGDVIMAIDGKDTVGLTVYEAVKLIRGPKGTPVKLLISRQGWKESKEFSVVRDEIVTESVKWKMVPAGKKKLAVITMTGFKDDTIALFMQAASFVLEEKADGIVLDLRNNPGGWLNAAVAVVGSWVGREPVVEIRPKNGPGQTMSWKGPAKLRGIPTAVLVNKGSASASEVVTGALQDYGKVRVFGEKTYGKGSGQQGFPFEDGSVLHLTTFLWYTPKGRTIEKTGIMPDETVVMTPQDKDKGRDPQMDRAVQFLLTGK
jgi:carboxyl-terminal processing protease